MEPALGALPVQLAFVVIYLTLAFYAARWNRGVLPVAAALAVLLAIFALVAGPAWFDRENAGFAAPAFLNAELLGLLTLIVIPVQMLLIAFAMRGFSQGWNVELEQRDPAGPDIHTRVSPAPRLTRGRPIGAAPVAPKLGARVRRWRNGRRGALKRPCPKGRVGSNPTRRIVLCQGIGDRRLGRSWTAGPPEQRVPSGAGDSSMQGTDQRGRGDENAPRQILLRISSTPPTRPVRRSAARRRCPIA